MKLPIAAHKLVPHREPMLFIDSLVCTDEEGGRATAILTKEAIAMRENGNAMPLIGVELLAQTYAAVKEWEARLEGRSLPQGFLVGVRAFTVDAPIPLAKQLDIDVHTIGELEGFAVVEGTISYNGERIASGKIKLWVPEDEV